MLLDVMPRDCVADIIIQIISAWLHLPELLRSFLDSHLLEKLVKSGLIPDFPEDAATRLKSVCFISSPEAIAFQPTNLFTT
jgi:hypothetical protein